MDGSPYTYGHFRETEPSCPQPDQGYYYASDSSWDGPQNGILRTLLAVCSKKASPPISTTDVTTTSFLFDTTSPAQPPDHSTTEDTSSLFFETTSISTTEDTTTYFGFETTSTVQTSDHSQTESTLEDSTEPNLTTLPTTTSRIDAQSLQTWEIALIVIGSIAIFGILIATILCVRRCVETKRAKTIEMRLYGEKKPHMTSQAKSLRYYDLPRKSDEWEIERKFVSIDYMKILGNGAFGSVFVGRILAKNIPSGMERSIIELAALKANNDFVAVKMMHESSDALTEREFCAEIEIMKRIGYHERLVNILACITQSEPMLLITEHCAHGDLLHFMRQKRKYMFEYPDDLNEHNIITFKQQVMYAIQIAYGLEYLSSRGFIHRDIAARNIMVDHYESCKIGDFGLCRAIGKEEQMYQSQGGKLPLKWMSPEAIENYLFSTASDVWAYGIVLFEIATLGGTPYADWAASELLPRLKQGHRMAIPDCCNEQLFEIMTDCWADLPSKRPTIANLKKRLGVLLEDLNPSNYYLKLNTQAHYYVLESG